ncbi:cidABC operon transcriptional activator CidR [Paenibacillus hunanensis]|uniref:DNA-binding transcriptional LysR family regulator n=1 Tax=Paenibacillus hunanensis TaxID=539262 RepID=A0ABU1IV95_9BACL|nr:LysR family transcriptional regulator [Paenibacillus hunanensis]MCL9661631.1 LysR family transcriptional regulator [Paenibacillus hunanensis]MDR6242836.1 DNA-binding transcriptional LysR family regulator [Paenibacillus hunanensis]WPP41809.1 LysR family transcriptional regulator [Paenibacillus hunanensis]GGJ03100.1 putative HTH-type transcriptional regulator YwbI [Paenibacillus hunanensis]
MDIRHLQYFMEVVRLGSFTRAAEALFITQPTISKTIRALEEELGAALFNRVGRSIELTDAGRVIEQQAQNIVKSFESLSSQLDDLRNLKSGHLRIGLPPMIGSRFFPRIIGQFHQLYPNVTIQLFEDGGKKVENDVVSGALDIGVAVLPVSDQVLEYFSFREEKLNLLVPVTHPLAGREQAELIELAEDSFIIFREDFTLHGRIIDSCIRAGFQPKIIYESSQWDLISEMVSAGLGIALLPETICRQINQEKLHIVPDVQPAIPWQLGMIWHRERYLSFAAREWLRFTREQMQKR